ncbi:hypothetical protein ABZY36_28740 [Streptomyces sp. NPDC006627]|uniref:hypothetical protein n=1 Tax=Streptomyces sp. NPDC006627 TaxID=3154679 RepID=UPI0033B677A2
MNPALTRAVTLGAGLLLMTSPLAAASALAGTSDSKPGPAGQPAPRPTLTAKTTVDSVKAWQQFRVIGTATRLPAGTRVTLQQLRHKQWVDLPVQMSTTRAHSYSLRVKLGLKGLNKMRIAGGGVVSNSVHVTVR